MNGGDDRHGGVIISEAYQRSPQATIYGSGLSAASSARRDDAPPMRGLIMMPSRSIIEAAREWHYQN